MASELPPEQRGISPNDELGLLDILVFIYRNRLWVVSLALVFGIGSYIWFEAGKAQYEATATCLVVENNPKQVISLSLCERMVGSVKIAQKVTDKLVQKKLLDPAKPLGAGFAHAKIQDGRALTISTNAETPELAAMLANETAAALTEVAQSLKTEMIDDLTTTYGKEIPAIQKDVQVAETRRNEIAAKHSRNMQDVYQKWRTESNKADEVAKISALALQRESLELLQAYQADTFAKVRALEEMLKLDYLRAQMSLLSARGTSQRGASRESLNAIALAEQPSVLHTREAAATSSGPSTWPKPKTEQISKTAPVELKPEPIVQISTNELQTNTGDFLNTLASELGAVKPEAVYEPSAGESVNRAEVAKAVAELAHAEAAVRKLQADRDIGFLRLRQERAAKMEAIKSDLESRQRDLLFSRDQELTGLRFAQDSADEQALADLNAKRALCADMEKANNAAILSKAENGANEIQIIDLAIPPVAPTSRNSFKFALMAAALGALLGFGIAATREVARISKKTV